MCAVFKTKTMKQKYAVVVLFALIMASSLVSLTSYRATEQLVTEDMNQAPVKRPSPPSSLLT